MNPLNKKLMFSQIAAGGINWAGFRGRDARAVAMLIECVTDGIFFAGTVNLKDKSSKTWERRLLGVDAPVRLPYYPLWVEGVMEVSEESRRLYGSRNFRAGMLIGKHEPELDAVSGNQNPEFLGVCFFQGPKLCESMGMVHIVGSSIHYDAPADGEPTDVAGTQAKEMGNSYGEAYCLTCCGMLDDMLAKLRCRNVMAVTRRVIAPKKRKRREGSKDITCKTLVITKPGSDRVIYDTAAPMTSSLAYHLVRGHYKTYPGGLFGNPKLAGTFWWPPTAKGNAKHGVVAKDYAVGPPAS